MIKLDNKNESTTNDNNDDNNVYNLITAMAMMMNKYDYEHDNHCCDKELVMMIVIMTMAITQQQL